MHLDVYCEIGGHELLTGALETTPQSNETFTYSKEWLEEGPQRPLSLSLPLQEEPFAHRQVRPYFDGLLPEGAPRSAVARRLHVSSSAYVKILGGIGWECIGAVSLHGDGPRPDSGYIGLGEGGIEAVGAALVSEGSWSPGETRFSLAGAQPKAALYHDEKGNWLRPVGGAPSTHIVKPAGARFSDASVNEAVCTIAAGICGIDVPEVKVIGGEFPMICTKRFDRDFVEGGKILDGFLAPMRLHQEDLCQALGIVSENKYEEGGLANYMERVAEVIRANSTNPINDLRKLWDAVAYAYVIGNCDMHLKNLSLVRSADWRELRLAPLYDMVATAQYEGLSQDLAMGIGGKRRLDAITPDHFAAQAKTLMLPAGWAASRLTEIAGKAEDALSEAAAKLSSEGVDGAEAFVESIIAGVQARAKLLG